MTEPARRLPLHVDETTVRFLVLLTLGWSVIAVGLLLLGALAILGALVLAPLSFVTGCCALWVALGKSLWRWAIRILITPLVWYGMLLPTFDPQIVSMGGSESLWSRGFFFYGLPWAWVLVGLWTFFIAKVAEREEQLVRDDLTRGHRDPKLLVSAAAIAGIVVAVTMQCTVGSVAATLVAGGCSATLIAWLCARFPATIDALRRRRASP